MRHLLQTAVLLLLSACAGHGIASSGQVRAIGDRVADWQLAHMADFGYVRTFRDQTEQPTSWIQAAFHIGLARWAEATGDTDYMDALSRVARENEWRLGPLYWHADDQAIAQVYLFLAERREDANVGHVVDAFDKVLAAPPDNSLAFDEGAGAESEGTCQRRWCWCDALFMAPPAWAMLSNATGNPAYREYALREYFATRDFLYDAEERLFYRDSRFFGQRTPFGNKVFWSRGNGWVFAGLPLLLEALPRGHAARKPLGSLFTQMAAKLARIQHPGGYWASSLLDFAHDPLPETSGTAFITFGLAWGVNEGLLDPDSFGPAVEAGWAALERAVNDEGRPGWVQQVGNAPDQVRRDDTQLYGSGAILLAASEMLRYRRQRATW